MSLIKKIIKWFLIIALIIIVFTGIASAVVYKMFLLPTGNMSEPAIVRIKKGDTLMKTALNLKELGAIYDERVFVAAAKIVGVERTIRSGEYEITPEMSPKDVLFLILKGRVVEYPVTIPEGYNVYQILELLSGLEFVDEANFLLLIEDKEFMAKFGIDASNMEGYLFPDTYNLNLGMDEKEIITLLVKRHFVVLEEEKAKSETSSGLTDYEILILASIVEKEARVDDERALISAVFVNRLNIRMKLDSCATVIYGMWDDFNGNLTRAHLKKMTPYNTYLFTGLPKGPICNPGRAAIRAALNPTDSNYLYFVSKNDGTHYFSESLSEHNRAVYLYQKLRRYRK